MFEQGCMGILCKLVCASESVWGLLFALCIQQNIVHVVSYDIIMNLVELGYLYIGIQIIDASYSYAYVKYIFDLTVYHGFCYKLISVRTGS